MSSAKKVPHILFISGPPGIGKTSVGQAIAKQANLPHFDLDQELEQSHNKTISELIQEGGWLEFRRQESMALENLVRKLSSLRESSLTELGRPIPTIVISLGGGTVLNLTNCERMGDQGLILTLWGSERLISDRLKRRQSLNQSIRLLPIDHLNELPWLLVERRAAYLRCDLWLEVYDGEASQQIADRALKAWRGYRQASELNKAIPKWFSPPMDFGIDYQVPYVTPSVNTDIYTELSEEVDPPSVDPPSVDPPSVDPPSVTHQNPIESEMAQHELPAEIKQLEVLQVEESNTLLIHDYQVYFRSRAEVDLVENLRALTESTTQLRSKLGIITDDVVAHLYGGALVGELQSLGITAHLITFPVGEQSKQLRVVEALATRLLNLGFDRSDCLVALGGGVTGDLCGFLASIYLRGVTWVQIPTTLLAQVDSSVGAKTAVNHPLGKNLIGSFYRPHWVWIDEHYLRTLPPRQIRSGWVEALKHGLIMDSAFFEQASAIVETDGFTESPNALAWMPIIKRAIEIKATIVREDELEENLRGLLNLGHTMGHAIEKTKPALFHGEAVALGLSFTVDYATRYHDLPLEEGKRIKAVLMAAGFENKWRDCISDRTMEFIEFDKKRAGQDLKFVILSAIGIARIEYVDVNLFRERVFQLMAL